MNILMLTNTFTPHVGGVARSVEAFAAEYRRAGHRVLVVAPQFEHAPAHESGVVRIPAIQKFNGSDFSVRLPIPGLLSSALREFQPEIVHAHHPFLLGDTAVRIAASWNLPLVFTHHTMYERYTHYVPGDSPMMARFARNLATGYANLCDRVFAPSESVAAILRERGVATSIEVVPTGVDTGRFAEGDGAAARRRLGIPTGAFVVGHLGRLAPEKNLVFLAQAVAAFLKRYRHAHFLLVGSGPSEQEVREVFDRLHLERRFHLAGVQGRQELVDIYHAMDVFAFASQSETQGMVLTEAMAAGVPVVAVDAPGVREVVVDGENGRLLPSQNAQSFVSALAAVASAPAERRAAMGQAARRTAEKFSLPRTAARALAVYESLVAAERTAKQTEDSAWEAALRLIESEWELWSNIARSAQKALPVPSLWEITGLGAAARLWQRLRRWVNRGEWGIKLLRLPTSEGTATEPGLIMLQIDGLSRAQFEAALWRKRMPFLRRLIRKEGYQVHSVYSGLPSSTPAVQGEFFYGVKGAVPSFSFRERHTRQVVRMFDPEPAARVQSRLGTRGRPLLDGGSAYCDIYTGGATESHFCSSAMGWGDLMRRVHPLAMLAYAVWHIPSVLRIAGLVVLESVLAVVDFFRGLRVGRSLGKELKFVPSRVAICVLLRELITIGATIDAARGLPVIHLNFLGYDEQAHRRGPGSLFAHWSLKGIDGCIRRIWRAARRSRRRDYQLWVYSDHGQERTLPFAIHAGRTVQEAVAAVFDAAHAEEAAPARAPREEIESQRTAWLGGRRIQRVLKRPEAAVHRPAADRVVVAAMGPVGQVYPPTELTAPQRAAMAERLVAEAGIPLVMTFDDEDLLWAFTRQGRFQLPEEVDQIIGPDHPFREEVAHDLVRLCSHPDAGDLVIAGWRRAADPLSFPQENGAHAGPGPEETHAFALLGPGVYLPSRTHGYLRPLDLRRAAFHALGRAPLHAGKRPARPRAKPNTLRVMTYNVHSCVGMDGRVSPARVARLIAHYDPDIVALQEVDVRRARTGDVDQAHFIARELEMDFHFHPAFQVEEERYGDAVLSRHPVRLVRAECLPQLPDVLHREPRGALWVEIEAAGRTIQLVNTHLSLSPRERQAQIEALLGNDWLAHPQCRDPLVLCGDLNAMPRSRGYRRLALRLRDAQMIMENHRPKQTWFSQYPLSRIDHVFVGENLEVVRIEVPRTDLARKASDHLPLIVDLRIVP